MLVEPLLSMEGLLGVLERATPLILTGLAAAVAFRSNLFNIGVEGQLSIGALAAAVVGFSLTGLPWFIHLPLAIAAAFLAGGLFATIAAILKVKFRVHEVISTIMMNYMIMSIISYLVTKIFNHTSPSPRTPDIEPSAALPKLLGHSMLNYGFVLSLFLIGIVYYFLFHTPWGWKIRAVSENMEAAQFSGIKHVQVMILVMFISGGIAALCGAERILGAYGYYKTGFSPNYGFDGIAVAIIGRKHPVGVLFAALLIGLLYYGGTNVSMITDVPKEWTMVLVAIMILLIASEGEMFKKLFRRQKAPSLTSGGE
jgi:simple sugar transport system permease protein